MNKLSLVILTYNRRDKLINQLHSIFSQPESKEVNIEIIDNHSDYDVEEAIINEFGKGVTEYLRVNRHPVNYGMAANLAMPFIYCRTPWMWTLSDDDETTPGSIKMILHDIEMYPDTAMFKYNTNDAGKDYGDAIVKSLPELIDFCESKRINGGWLIFLSNNVYNTQKAIDNYGLTLSNCYSAIAHLLPLFNILDSKKGVVRIMESQPIRFNRLDAGVSSYPLLRTAVGVSSIVCFKYDLSYKYYKKLGFLVTSGFPHYLLSLNALEMPDRKQGKYLYETVYRNAFKHSGHFIDRLYHLFYLFCYVTHIKIGVKTALRFRETVRRVNPSFR